MSDQPTSPYQEPDPTPDPLPDATADSSAYSSTEQPPPPAGLQPQAPPVGLQPAGPVGTVRNTGTCFLLTIVTLGFYTWYWYFKTHEEMKRHSGQGIGGGIALLLAIFVGIVMPFLNSHEVGGLYERRGQKPPVTAVTGLWALLLGWFFFVGLIIWFVRTNAALNDYWKSLGAS